MARTSRKWLGLVKATENKKDSQQILTKFINFNYYKNRFFNDQRVPWQET